MNVKWGGGGQLGCRRGVRERVMGDIYDPSICLYENRIMKSIKFV
jgi:hypothetical protein